MVGCDCRIRPERYDAERDLLAIAKFFLFIVETLLFTELCDGVCISFNNK